MLKKLWYDPVWSKVIGTIIATIIISLAGGIWWYFSYSKGNTITPQATTTTSITGNQSTAITGDGNKVEIYNHNSMDTPSNGTKSTNRETTQLLPPSMLNKKPPQNSEKAGTAKHSKCPSHYILTKGGLTWDDMDYKIKHDPKANGYSLPTVAELKTLVRCLSDDEFQRNFFWSSDADTVDKDKIFTVNLSSGNELLQKKGSINRVVLVLH